MMMKQFKPLLVLVLLVMLVGCKSAETKQVTGPETTAYKGLTQKWKGQAKYEFNKDRSYVLAQSEPPATADYYDFSYFVFDMKAEKVVLQGDIASGFVKWISEKEIEVFQTPGKMGPTQTRDDYTEVINVETGKSTPKTDWKK